MLRSLRALVLTIALAANGSPATQASGDNPADFSGLWLTDLGLMNLEQTGEKAKGHYAQSGVGDIEGTVAARRFDFTFRAFRSGKGHFDLSADGKAFAGSATVKGASKGFDWKGRQAPEFALHARLVPGKIVGGSTKGLLTYSVRAPEGFKEGDAKKWPAIVILHGSNMNGEAYVNTIAATWPDIAEAYILLGINGEQPSAIGDEPRFNYTYVDYCGKSTFKGFPGTDRESPGLVAEALTELRSAYPIGKYFVGGHSQGGFLTYSLLMNFPEMFAGAFPVSGGVIFQCEPSAFEDAKLKAAQRAVPLAIVHGKQDPNVSFSSGEYAATLFGESGWHAFRFFADGSGAGHRFALLPVGPAIRWLESIASDDPEKLLAFAEQRMKEKSYRDAIAALDRTRSLKLDDAATKRLDSLSKQIDAKAAVGAKEFLPKIKANGKGWIDAFLTWRDDFEFAPAAYETMEAFNALRAEQEAPAKTVMDEARAAFNQNNRDGGYAKYQEIVGKYPAASSYRNVKRWLGERKQTGGR